MKPPISERIVRPQECVIAFAIPTSDETFKNHLRLKRDFASMYRNPGRYREHVARVYQSVEPAFRKLGVQVREEVTLQQFSPMFPPLSRRYPATSTACSICAFAIRRS